DEHPAPPATGLVAVAGLEARLEMSDRDAVAPPGVPRGAVRARWFLATGFAAEDAAQHDALPGLQVLAVVQELPDHLVPRDERGRDEGREVERRSAGEGGEVRSADTRQQGPDAGPSRSTGRRLGILHRDEPQRGQGTGPPARRLRTQPP